MSVSTSNCENGKNSITNSKYKKQSESRASIVKFYLLGYNIVQTVGWSILFYQLISHYLFPSEKSLYDTIELSVMIFQNAAILEVFHAFVGFVKSNPVLTLFQVASRVLVVCGVLLLTQASRVTIGLPLALLAWTITEIIRYSNYALNLVNMVPYFHIWLRYTTFIVLYPIGITGELLCIYAAQKEIGESNLYSIQMPNKWNLNFNYQQFLWFIMALYIPLFPQLYLHMFSQRKKALGPASKKTN